MASLVRFVSLALVGCALVQKRLGATPIAGPMGFFALGMIAGWPSAIDADSEDIVTVVDVVFQATLVLVLFTDAVALHFSS